MDKEFGLNVSVSGGSKYPPSKNERQDRMKVSSKDEKWNSARLLMHNSDSKYARLTELQQQNCFKTRRVYPRKLGPPRAPRNTSSFLMRAKRAGLVDEVSKEYWGVDNYGSMHGLIRLRSVKEGEGEKYRGLYESKRGTESKLENGYSHSAVQQLEQRIGHCLSRFEIVCPPRPR